MRITNIKCSASASKALNLNDGVTVKADKTNGTKAIAFRMTSGSYDELRALAHTASLRANRNISVSEMIRDAVSEKYDLSSVIRMKGRK